MAKGERLLKDVYEALRASPKWNSTLLFVGYDDAGGYYDHVVPPFEGVPADESPCHINKVCGKWPRQHGFDFRRLGLRVAAMLIGPHVNSSVIQEPRAGPHSTSQFELTSIASTVKTLFNLTSFLTARDAWSGTFEELLLDEPRADATMPRHLPDAPEPAAPWSPPPSEEAADGAGPGHCSAWDGAAEEKECRGRGHASLKQRRNVRLLSELTGTPAPDLDGMDTVAAGKFLRARWENFMEQRSSRREALAHRGL